MNVARADSGAATGILNAGGNLGGIVCQPIVAAFSAPGAWNVGFQTGAVLALVAAGAWMLIDADRTLAPVSANHLELLIGCVFGEPRISQR